MMRERLRRFSSFRQYSLATQMSIALGGVSLQFIALIGVIITILISTRLEDHLLQDRRSRARNVALPIQAYIDEQQEQLLFALDYQIPAINPAEFLQTRLREALARNTALLEIVLIAPDGTVIASERRGAETLLNPVFPIQNARWFQVNRQGQDFMSSIYTSPRNTPYVLLSLLIRQPTYQGYSVAARVDIREIGSILNQQELETDENAYLLDEQGNLIASTQAFPPLTSLTSPILQPPYQNIYHNAADDEVLGASVAISNTPWIAVNELSAQRAFEDIRQIRISIALLTLAGAIMALVVGRLLARQIISPLHALATQTAHLEAGDYQYKIEVQTSGEIRSLGLAFNRLGEVISERELDLRNTNTILKQRSQEMAVLSRQIIAVEEEERRRISRDVHDGFGQTLAALKMTLDVMQSISDPHRRDALLKDASVIIEQAIDEAHNISQNLRPTVLDDLGLVAALDWYLRQFERRFPIKVRHELNSRQPVPLTAEGEITAFRFVQEALTNVHKHAEASEVTLRLRQQANYLMLAVKDNGKGFNYLQKRSPTERMHLGLSGMRERLTMIGGELVIHSVVGEGTTLIALVPMQIDDEDQL